MIITNKSSFHVSCIIALFLWLPTTTYASIILNLDSIEPWVVDNSYYEWTYSAMISDDDGLGGDTFFTIYDLPGTVITVTGPVDWNIYSSQNDGITPTGLTLTDDTSLTNVTYQFTGGTWPGSSTPLVEGFRIVLDTDIFEASQYAWQDYVSYPLVDPVTREPVQLQVGVGTVVDGRQESIPEPTTLVLMGLGLAGIGFRRRKAS